MTKYGNFDLDLVINKPMDETQPGDQGSTEGAPRQVDQDQLKL